MVDSLLRVIVKLRSLDESCPALAFVSNLSVLITVFEKIHCLVGLNLFKDKIARQFKYFLVNYNRTGKLTKDDMMNAVFYGPPGVGKTQCGELLAEFWGACTILREPVSKNPCMRVVPRNLQIPLRGIVPVSNTYRHHQGPETGVSEENSRVKRKLNKLSAEALEAKTILNKLRKSSGGDSKNHFMFSVVKKFITNVADSYERVVLPGLIPVNTSVNIFGNNKPPVQVGENVVRVPTKIIVSPPSVDISETKTNFVVITRVDIVRKYQGHTAAKVQELADKYDVIMIDEAYSLIVDELDTYGIEASVTICNIMDKSPGKPKWIFSGYRNKMDELFKMQPGFPRRFLWHTNMIAYTLDELAHIFRIQMSKRDLVTSDTEFQEILSLFNNNSTLFPDYGGSTKKLCYSIGSTVETDPWEDVLNGNVVNLSGEYTAKDVSNGLKLFQHGVTSPETDIVWDTYIRDTMYN
jgi:DNA polymerase III delta prime subunit